MLAWAKELLSRWKDTLMKPDQLAVWTYFDRDIPTIESYAALIGDRLADVTFLSLPVCNVQLSRTTFANGEPVIAQTVQVIDSNPFTIQ